MMMSEFVGMHLKCVYMPVRDVGRCFYSTYYGT